MILRHLLCISMVWSGLCCNAQRLRLTQIRLGFDPVFSLTMMGPKLDTRKYQMDYRNYEVFIELIGPYRISLLGEFGQTNVSMNVINNVQIFTANGTYGRLGFNFIISKPDKKHEFDVGWRVGVCRQYESASIIHEGQYWDNTYLFPLEDRIRVFIWGEALIEYKASLFPKSKNALKDIWFGGNFRVRVANSRTDPEGYKSQLIAGYGLNSNSMVAPGLQFSLFYIIHLKRGTVHKAHHLHNNYDIIEKDHHIYKIKRYKGSADEIDRD